MILADSSVWIAHLRRGVPALADALEQGDVAMHPWIVGELACGNLRDREEILALLQRLPVATVATDAEVMTFVEQRRLMGRGLGWVDAHLLASAVLSGHRLWTLDGRLGDVATNLVA